MVKELRELRANYTEALNTIDGLRADNWVLSAASLNCTGSLTSTYQRLFGFETGLYAVVGWLVFEHLLRSIWARNWQDPFPVDRRLC